MQGLLNKHCFVTAEFKIFISPADCGVWIHPHFYTDLRPWRQVSYAKLSTSQATPQTPTHDHRWPHTMRHISHHSHKNGCVCVFGGQYPVVPTLSGLGSWNGCGSCSCGQCRIKVGAIDAAALGPIQEIGTRPRTRKLFSVLPVNCLVGTILRKSLRLLPPDVIR